MSLKPILSLHTLFFFLFAFVGVEADPESKYKSSNQKLLPYTLNAHRLIVGIYLALILITLTLYGSNLKCQELKQECLIYGKNFCKVKEMISLDPEVKLMSMWVLNVNSNC